MCRCTGKASWVHSVKADKRKTRESPFFVAQRTHTFCSLRMYPASSVTPTLFVITLYVFGYVHTVSECIVNLCDTCCSSYSDRVVVMQWLIFSPIRKTRKWKRTKSGIVSEWCETFVNNEVGLIWVIYGYAWNIFRFFPDNCALLIFIMLRVVWSYGDSCGALPVATLKTQTVNVKFVLKLMLDDVKKWMLNVRKCVHQS